MFKKAFSTVACMRLAYEDIIKQSLKHHIEGVEIRLDKDGGICGLSDITRLQELADRFEEEGLAITDLGSSACFCGYDETVLGIGKRAVDKAAIIHVKAIRIFLGNFAPKKDAQKRTIDYKGIVKALRELCDYAALRQVEIWIETHNEFSTGEVLQKLLADADRDNLFIIWDVMHPIELDESIERTWETIGQKIAHVHIKDGYDRRSPEWNDYCYTKLGEGEIPLRAIMDLLVRESYQGYVSFEWEKAWRGELAEFPEELSWTLEQFNQFWDEQVMLPNYFSGYTEISSEDRYFFPYRFGHKQREFYQNEGDFYGLQSRYLAGVRISANHCKSIRFEFWGKEGNGTEFCLETVVKEKIWQHRFFESTGVVEFTFDEDDVDVYFPYYMNMGVKNIEIIGEPCKRERVILSYGDSITQGYMTDEVSMVYPSVLGREFHAEVYNFGIGGYFMKEEVLNELDILPKPWMITFAYGTNDWHFEHDYTEDLPKIFDRIHEKYPQVPVVVILPIVRRIEKEQRLAGTLEDVRNDLRKEAAKYSNFIVVNSGKNLEIEKHLSNDGTHPNPLGMRAYGKSIVEDITGKGIR